MTIIEQIKAEIERLKNKMDDRDPLAPNQQAGYLFALEDVLSFLSTLETPVSDDLKKEVKKYISKDTPELWTEIDDYEYTSVPLCWMYDFARHFVEWGVEHTKDKSPSDAEDAAKEYARYHYADTFSQELAENDFLAGSAWNEMHMMKEAICGNVYPDDKEIWCSLDRFPELKEGDKVRIIVCKNED